MTQIIIAKIGKNDTVNYAADELYRCLRLSTIPSFLTYAHTPITTRACRG